MNKIAGFLAAASLIASPMLASAQGASANASAQVQAMLAQIQTLQAQVQAMKTAQIQLNTAASSTATTLSLIRNLRQGMSGEDVAALQAILAADPTIYPQGTISGFYGSQTAAAVKKFQKKNGIETLGTVGPKTLKKLNEAIKELGLAREEGNATSTSNANEGKKLCAKVPPGHLIAPGWLKKNGGVKPAVPECQTLPKGIQDKMDGNWNNGSTTSDKLAPVISAISTVPGVTNGTVYWTTNEFATTKVYYGTTSSIDTNATTTLSVSNANLVLNHSITITGLTGSTLYYYVVESKDPAGNKATSSVSSFTTAAVPDTTAPIISGLTTSNLLGTTTSIVWTTNESANSKIWFGTSTPVSTLGAANITDANFMTNHSLSLSGLATSTTYYYVVTSADSAGNTATSSQGSFITTAGL